MDKIAKNDEKDEKTLISVLRSFTCPQADGKLKNFIVQSSIKSTSQTLNLHVGLTNIKNLIHL